MNPDGSNSWKDDKTGKHKHAIFIPSVDVDSVVSYTEELMKGSNHDGGDVSIY